MPVLRGRAKSGEMRRGDRLEFSPASPRHPLPEGERVWKLTAAPSFFRAWEASGFSAIIRGPSAAKLRVAALFVSCRATMTGQGSPMTSPARRTSPMHLAIGWGCQWMLAAALVVCAPAWLPAESLKIRIAWGGGAERIWQGKITLSEGRLDQPRPLGIEADEPGSMWIQDGAWSSANAARGPTTAWICWPWPRFPQSSPSNSLRPVRRKSRAGSRCRFPACWKASITPISTRTATGY